MAKQTQCQYPHCRTMMTPRVGEYGVSCPACGWVQNTDKAEPMYDPPAQVRNYWGWLKPKWQQRDFVRREMEVA